MLVATEFRMGMQMPPYGQQLLLEGLDLRLELIVPTPLEKKTFC